MIIIDELQGGRYHYVRLLGSGGMGEVYLMQDTRVNRQVAIKIIRSENSSHPDSDIARKAARLFQREAKAIAALEHPHILPLYDFGEEIYEDMMITYMIMPYCSEGSLANWLRQRGGPLAPRDITYLVNQAADGLQHAHDLGVIHLDVKPSNFLLRGNKKNPNRPALLLADFGIAKFTTATATASQSVRGSPTYMAPEQWSGEPVLATDQYALAMMAYDLLAGRFPFVGSIEQLLFQHFTAQPPPPSTFNPRLSADVDAVILRALAKKAGERFPSVIAFASALEQAVQALPAEPAVDPQSSDDPSLNAVAAISPSEAEAGIICTITLPGGKRVNVPIPAGTRDGQVIRVQGTEGETPPPGALLITVSIKEPVAATSLSNSNDVSDAKVDGELHTSDPGIQQKQLSQMVPGHDLPTPSSVDSGISVTEKRLQPVPKRSPITTLVVSLKHISLKPAGRLIALALQAKDQFLPAGLWSRSNRNYQSSTILRLSIIGITSLVVILQLLFGSIYLFNNRQNGLQSISNSPNHVPTTTVGVKLSPTSTPAHTATVPIRNGLYIADTYNGTMFNETTQQTSTISVSIVQSRGNGALSGSITFHSPDQGIRPLRGTIDLQGNFSFTVQQPAGQTPLYFSGAVQHLSDGSYLHGNFCNSSTNSCSTFSGYFTVGPGYQP